MAKNKNVGGLGDADNLGEVDFMGLDEFGIPASRELWGAVIGGGIGTGAALAARAMTQTSSSLNKHSEAIGMLAGMAAGGVMYATGQQAMGITAMATAAVTNGLRELANMLFPQKFSLADIAAMQAYAMTAGACYASAYSLPAAAAYAPAPAALPPAAPAYSSSGATTTSVSTGATSPSGWGGVVIDPAYRVKSGLGIHAIEPGYAVPGGLGTHVIDKAYPIPAGLGAARHGGPPQLVGAGDYGLGTNPAVTQTKILGGPAISTMGAHFGATLYGGNS